MRRTVGAMDTKKYEICTLNDRGLLHERPYRLAALATSPALAGEAKMP